MFWLYYGINKNNSTAQHYSDGHSHRYEEVSKDRWKPELPPSISPEQLFPTPVPDRADMEWESLVPQHPTQHNSNWAMALGVLSEKATAQTKKA